MMNPALTSSAFLPDNKTTPDDKNLILSQHLTGSWFNLNIVEIKRIESSPQTDSGWEVTFK